MAHARDLIALERSLCPLPELKSILASLKSEKLKGLHSVWDNAEDIVQIIESAILDEPAFLLTEGGIIKPGYFAELDELRTISQSGKSFIAGLETQEKKKTGITSLKIRYNKVFGYYIDITKPNLSLVPQDYIRKQTLVNSERFITPELKEYEEKVLHAEEQIKELEYKLFIDLREKIAAENQRLQKIASAVALLDVLMSLAELASQRSYSRPSVHKGDSIRIKDGRHPVIETTNDEPFIPNRSSLSQGQIWGGNRPISDRLP